MAARPITPGRARRVCKWTALVLTLLLAAAWDASGWYQASWAFRDGNTQLNNYLEKGQIGMRRTSFLGPELIPVVPPEFGLYPAVQCRLSERWIWWMGFRTTQFSTYSESTVWVPLWLLLLAALAPTALLWHRDRHALRRGHCPRCAYNLTGLPDSSPCPECGASRSANPEATPRDAR